MVDPAFDPGSNGAIVHAIFPQSDGKILVGGQFNMMGGQPRNNIARLDPVTGLADVFDPNANGIVYSIVQQATGKILVAGAFSGPNSIAGQLRNRIARLDPNTGLADSFDPNANKSVLCIAIQADSHILVGGDFSGAGSIGAAARNRIARLDRNTGLADLFDPNANNTVRSIVVQTDGKILVGGRFQGTNSIGGQSRDYLARLDPTNGNEDAFDPRPNGIVNSLATESNGKILVGGVFGQLKNGATTITRNNFARLEVSGAFDQSLDSDVLGTLFGQ